MRSSLRNPMVLVLLASTLGHVVAGLSPAVAQTFNVKTIDVDKGSFDLGVDNTFQSGFPAGAGSEFNRTAHEISLNYGLTAWWKIAALFKPETPIGEGSRLANVALENIFVLRPFAEGQRSGLGLGWYATLDVSTHADTTNVFTTGPILVAKADRLSFAANPFFEQTFGRNHVEGIALSYGWQAKYELGKQISVGIEGFGAIDDIGNSPSWSNQEHRIGPAIFTEVDLGRDFKVTPDLGVLFGLTRSTPDVAVKLNVGVPLGKIGAMK
jgi:hypothetical protein